MNSRLIRTGMILIFLTLGGEPAMAAGEPVIKPAATQTKAKPKVRVQVLKLIPRKLIEQVYPPDDTLAQSWPRLFMTPEVRRKVEKQRLLFYKKRYGLLPVHAGKRKSAPRKRPPRYVEGIVKDQQGGILVSINGRFQPLRQLLGKRRYRVLSFQQDQLKLQVNGRTYVIEVGSRWRF